MTVRKKILEISLSVLLICAMVATFIPMAPYSKIVGSTTSKSNIYNIRGLYSERKDSLDMIYIGGSACYVFWEALRAWKDYGYTSYSFAADSFTPQSIKYCIQEAQKTQHPKLWVIDLRPFQYGDETDANNSTPAMYRELGIRNVTDNLNYSSLRKELIDISVLDKSKRLEYYFPFFKYHAKVAANLIKEVRQVLTGELRIDDTTLFNTQDKENRLKGFWFIEDTKAVDFTDYRDVTEITPLEGKVNEYFIDLLDFCKEKSITPLFVVHSYCQEKEDKQKYNYMKQVIESYGFDFLNTNDYYQEIGLDYSFDFYNENHVNIFGAEKYTDFLAAYIENRYDMPDHRSESSFGEWNVCADEFNEQVKNTKMAIFHYARDNR